VGELRVLGKSDEYHFCDRKKIEARFDKPVVKRTSLRHKCSEITYSQQLEKSLLFSDS
jgi:ribosomal protein L20